MSEFSGEPIPGLPEHLPTGETILWQGKPSAWPLARQALHVRKIALYFGVVGLWLAVDSLASGAGLVESSGQLLSQIAVGGSAILLLALFAWLVQRTTIYTLTNRRLVMRFGVALPITVNLPFSRIESADLRSHGDGNGDISLRVDPEQRVSTLLFWPHVRPWHWRQPQPTLRCVDGVEQVAALLADALADDQGREPVESPAAAGNHRSQAALTGVLTRSPAH